MDQAIDVDPSELDPQTIRFRGSELGVVTELPNGTSRLVLKPVYENYKALAQLVEDRGDTVIDVEMPAPEVRERVIQLAEREDEDSEDIPKPSGRNPYVIVGNTYPIRDRLKELGLNPTFDTAADCSRSRQVTLHKHSESGVLKGWVSKMG